MSSNILDELIEKESCINFYDDWLQVADYELKFLILTSILAENNLAYRGTISDICNWLGVKPYSKTNKKIKQAIESLQDKGYLFYKLDGRTYTLTISEKGMKDKQIVKIRKAWVNAFKTYNKDENNNKINRNISIDWIKILKVFVYLYSRKGSSLLTRDTIALDLNLSLDVVSAALKAICECELNGIKVTKTIVKENLGTDKKPFYRNKGTDINILINLE